MYSPPDVVLAPERNPTPLSREYLVEVAGPGRIRESLWPRSLDGLLSGDEGIPNPYPWFFDKPSGLGGGRLVTLWPPRGGWGNEEAIDAARFGVNELLLLLMALGVSREGPDRGVEDGPDAGRPKAPDEERPGDVGRREVRRIDWSDGFELRELGRDGRADVGGFEALNERGVRGDIDVVAIVSEGCY